MVSGGWWVLFVVCVSACGVVVVWCSWCCIVVFLYCCVGGVVCVGVCVWCAVCVVCHAENRRA